MQDRKIETQTDQRNPDLATADNNPTECISRH